MLVPLSKNGIGTTVGRVILSTLDYMKPDLAKPLAESDATVENMKEPEKKAAPLKGFQHFQKVYESIDGFAVLLLIITLFLFFIVFVGTKNDRRNVQ